MSTALSIAVSAPLIPLEPGSDDPLGRQRKIIDFEHYRHVQPNHSFYEKSPSSNETLYFPLTVDESLSDQAQQLVKYSCGDSIISLSVEPLVKKHQSKIWVTMKAAAWSIALHAIIGLSAAELGPVTHIHAGLNS